MPKMFGGWLLVWCLAIGGIQLAGSNAVAADPDPALRQGIDKYHEGDQQEALSLLRGFVIRNYDSPELPRAYLYLARIFQNSGSHRDALLYTGRIPSAQKGPEALLVEGVSLVATGQEQAGLDLLLKIPPAELNVDDRVRWTSALADALGRLGNYLEALTFIQRGANNADGKFLELAHVILRQRLSPSELAEAAVMFRGTAIGEDAVLQQALQAHRKRNLEEAKRLTAAVLQSSTPFPYRDEAVALWKKLDGSALAQRSIAVLLPASGRYASFGALVRRGMELAADLHNQQHPAINLIFRDAGAAAEETSRIVSELAGNSQVMAIAGPLTAGAALVAAGQAQRLEIPLLALSPRDGLPEIGDFIFRDALTSRQQIAALVGYAMEQQGFTTFAMLHPETKFGYEMADLFVREVRNRGGQVVATQKYAATTTDFQEQIGQLTFRTVTGDAETAENDPSAPPEVPLPYQALFIPDYPDKISMIAPQLAFAGVENLPLLGINGWNSAELARTTGRYLQGAVFVDGFFPGSSDPAIRQFVENYVARYREEPGILDAQGFDVANLLFALLDRSEVQTRGDLRQALEQLRNFPGVSGMTSFDAAGNAVKPLFLLKIDGERIVQIN